MQQKDCHLEAVGRGTLMAPGKVPRFARDDNVPLLEVRDLRTEFRSGGSVFAAVDGVSFSLAPGETLGIVGESGCGKSVTSLSIMRLIPNPPGRIAAGEIRLEGRDLLELPET